MGHFSRFPFVKPVVPHALRSSPAHATVTPGLPKHSQKLAIYRTLAELAVGGTGQPRAAGRGLSESPGTRTGPRWANRRLGHPCRPCTREQAADEEGGLTPVAPRRHGPQRAHGGDRVGVPGHSTVSGCRGAT